MGRHANVKFEGLFAVVLRDWRRNLIFFVGTRRQLHPKVDTLFSSWNHPMSMHHRPSDVFFSVERFFDFVLSYSLVSQLGGRASVWCLKLELTSKRQPQSAFEAFSGWLQSSGRSMQLCLDKDH